MSWQTSLLHCLRDRDSREKSPCVALVQHHQQIRSRCVAVEASERDARQHVVAHEARAGELQSQLTDAVQRARAQEEMTSKLEESEKVNQGLSEKISTLESKTSTLEQNVRERDYSLTMVRQENEALRNENQMQRSSLAPLKEENARLVPAVLAAKATEAELRNEIMQLEARLGKAPEARPPADDASRDLVADDSVGGEVFCTPPSGIAHISDEASIADLHTVTVDEASKRIWTGGVEKSVRSWDIANGQPLSRLSCPGSVVCLDSKGPYLAGGCVDFTVRLWHLPTNRLHSQFTGHTEVVTAAYLNASAQHVFSASRDCTVKCWDIARGALSHTSLCAASCYDLAVNADRICTAHFDNTLRLWDIRSGKRAGEMAVHDKAVTSVRLTQCNNLAVSLSRDQTIRVSDLRMLREVSRFEDPTFNISSNLVRISVSPDGSLVAAGSATGAVFIWNIKNSTAPPKILTKGHTSAVMSVSWSPDGRGLASVGLDKRMVFWR